MCVGAVLLLCVLGICWVMRARALSTNAPNQPFASLPDNIEMRLNHVIFHGVSNGKIIWEIEADHFDVSQNQLTFRASGLRRVAMLKDGKQQLLVSAGSLERNILSGDIALAGDVTVSGQDLLLRTPNIIWNDRLQLFTIPGQLTAQFGDINLTCDGDTVYNLGAATVNANGHILLAVKGNTFEARGVTLNLVTQTFAVQGPAHAVAQAAELQQWAVGKNTPYIPDIPAPIKERYKSYRDKHGLN